MKKYWKSTIYLICVLLMILPISSTFSVEFEESNGEWTNNYVFTTIEYAIFFVPLFIVLIIIPRLKNRITKKTFIIISGLLSGVSFLWAIEAVTLPIQDFIPNWGIILLFILFPLVAIDSSLEWKKK